MDDVINIPLVFKKHKRARNFKLRYDALNDKALVTLPHRSSEQDALKFARKHVSWLQKQRNISPECRFLYPGYKIPFEGIDYLITHNPDCHGNVILSEGQIIVGGPIHGFSKRLENYLKKYARKTIESLANEMATEIGKKFNRIQIKDTKSRWGSCSSSGTLSFSWRLIMTPPHILHYVVAHEVAHLKEMNHSPAFWKVVDRLVDNALSSRKWLKSEGQKLMFILSEAPRNY
ncbi:MAG: M48 family metallopeptidase [Alphaproteobacteria bacterium]|nr:M48 family metallopeptidase [Alphaproteobacteria bacterium]HPF47951.1 SprT family zinc-dependent metalloprotease [Emcibacteraceae bacterium]